MRVAGDTSRSITYGELIGNRRFNLAFTGSAAAKPVSEYRVVGKPTARKDVTAKVSGNYVYMQVRVPGMLHGRIVRPREASIRNIAAEVQAAADAAGRMVAYEYHQSVDAWLHVRHSELQARQPQTARASISQRGVVAIAFGSVAHVRIRTGYRSAGLRPESGSPGVSPAEYQGRTSAF